MSHMANGDVVEPAPGAVQTERLKQGKADSTSEEPPTPQWVQWSHTFAPYRSKLDLHHRLGENSWDAASGTHRHRGGDDSVPLWDDVTITGDLATMAGLRSAVKGILNALSELGVRDSTTN